MQCTNAKPMLCLLYVYASLPGVCWHAEKAPGLALDEWPPGCLGYLCNLLRPARRGFRAACLFGLTGGTIIFETMEQASSVW